MITGSWSGGCWTNKCTIDASGNVYLMVLSATKEASQLEIKLLSVLGQRNAHYLVGLATVQLTNQYYQMDTIQFLEHKCIRKSV